MSENSHIRITLCFELNIAIMKQNNVVYSPACLWGNVSLVVGATKTKTSRLSDAFKSTSLQCDVVHVCTDNDKGLEF